MQIVDYEPSGRGSAILLAEGGEVDRLSLEPGVELSFALGERRCGGIVSGTRHESCPRSRAPACRRHEQTWICARCTGTCLKPEMDCHDDHAVYLAAFAPTVWKVGVTRVERLETRLREQGADRAAWLLEVPDGRLAREIEADIARTIPDRVGIGSKMDGLSQSVDADGWQRVLAEVSREPIHQEIDADVRPIETFEFDYGFELDRRPIRETLATGRVLGVKGRILVLEHTESTYAVDMRDLVGHEIESLAGIEARRGGGRQTSLDSFDRAI